MPLLTRKSAGVLLLVAVFMGVSALAQAYQATLAGFVEQGGAAGVLAFIVLCAVFTVFLIPLVALLFQRFARGRA